MKCKFIMPNMANCLIPSLKNKEYCCLHDKESTSIYFISDFEKFKKAMLFGELQKKTGNAF